MYQVGCFRGFSVGRDYQVDPEKMFIKEREKERLLAEEAGSGV